MNPEGQKLLDKAAHSLRAAAVLLENCEPDFAAGRAYYAMFYAAEALLLEKGLSFSKHSAVHAAYGQHFAKTGLLDPKFHRWIIGAFDERIRGDYVAGEALSREDVEELMERAGEFLQAARRFLGADE